MIFLNLKASHQENNRVYRIKNTIVIRNTRFFTLDRDRVCVCVCERVRDREREREREREGGGVTERQGDAERG